MKFSKTFLPMVSFFVTLLFASGSFAASNNTTYLDLRIGELNDLDFYGKGMYGTEYERVEGGALSYAFRVVQYPYALAEVGEYWEASLWNATTDTFIKALPRIEVQETVPTYMCLVQTNPYHSPGDGSNCFDPALSSYTQVRDVYVNLDVNCDPTDNYEIRIESSSNNGTYNYTLADFTLADPVVTGVNNILPDLVLQKPQSTSPLPEHTPGVITAQVQMLDAGGCGFPQAGVDVTLTTTIVQDSNAHLHPFEGGNRGTGTFTGSTGNTAHIFTATTGVDGLVDATYTAGIYGTTERFFVEADGQARGNTEYEENFDIKVDGFVEFLPENGMTITGTGTSNCDTTHNGPVDPAINRLSNWASPAALLKIHALNDKIKNHADLGGRTLCLNDLSLEFGGFFDDGDGTRATYVPQVSNYCHGGHRTGTGFDLNSLCGSFPSIKTDTVQYNNAPIEVVELYTILVNQLGGDRVNEGPTRVHYEF